MRSDLFAVLALVFLDFGQAGCQHIGPKTILEDRVPYSNALAASWKAQTLLNIVKLRYGDTPVFVDVAQITGGYTLQGGGSAAGSITPPVNLVASFAQQLGLILNLQGAYQDRPTISYSPQTGPQFIRNLTIPLPPSAILYLMQAGYPIDVVLDLTVDSINGVQGRSMSGGYVREASPEFVRVREILRKAQLAGGVGMRVEVGKDKKETTVLFLRDPELPPELAAELAEARRLLHIDPAQRSFRVVYGAARGAADEITFESLSIYRVLTELATYVQVPDVHLAEGRAPPLLGDVAEPQPRLTVRSGCEPPRDCFTAVCYRGYWFWIDDTDFQSKRTMAFLMVFLALADTGPKEPAPFLTIQAN
jgi:hypothetical protein